MDLEPALLGRSAGRETRVIVRTRVGAECLAWMASRAREWTNNQDTERNLVSQRVGYVVRCWKHKQGGKMRRKVRLR